MWNSNQCCKIFKNLRNSKNALIRKRRQNYVHSIFGIIYIILGYQKIPRQKAFTWKTEPAHAWVVNINGVLQRNMQCFCDLVLASVKKNQTQKYETSRFKLKHWKISFLSRICSWFKENEIIEISGYFLYYSKHLKICDNVLSFLLILHQALPWTVSALNSQLCACRKQKMVISFSCHGLPCCWTSSG